MANTTPKSTKHPTFSDGLVMSGLGDTGGDVPTPRPTSSGSKDTATKDTAREAKEKDKDKEQHSLLPACAECRRVKRKCNRKWPCQSCIRRGCASICPDGTLTPGGGGNRYILHGSEQLHRKITDMSVRIAQLEDALAILWRRPRGSGSDEALGMEDEHPLLRPDLLAIKLPPDTQNYQGPPKGGEEYDSKRSSMPSELGIVESTSEEDEEADLVVPGLENLALEGGGYGGSSALNGKENTERLGISTMEFRLASQPTEPTPPITPAYPPIPSSYSPYNLYHNSSLLSPHTHDGTTLPLAPTLLKIASQFPSSPPPDTSIDFSTCLLYLPPLELALRLCTSYFDNAAWTYGGIVRNEFVRGGELISLFYPTSSPLDNAGAKVRQPRPHDLALLYMVFAIGAIVDLSPVPASLTSDKPLRDSAKRYHTLAKACICLDSPLNGKGSIRTVQALSFMTDYEYMWEREEVKMDRVAIVMALASKLGITIGLHRERHRPQPPQENGHTSNHTPSKSKEIPLSRREIHKRRWVFWELLTDNAWQSLSSGRPPMIQMDHCDCAMPRVEDEYEHEDVGEKKGERSWLHHPHDFVKFDFTKSVLYPIIDSNFNLRKPVSYATVLSLDRRVREFVYPSVDLPRASREALAAEEAGNAGVKEGDGVRGWVLQGHISAYVKEHVLLHLHRAFFSRAMITHPDAPNDSPYASSFLAIFKCAVTLLESCKSIYEKLPEAIIPYGLFWTDVLMSAVAMGTICSRGPRGPFAPLAFEHLNNAVEIAEQRFAQLPRTKGGLPILYKIRQAAQTAIASVGPRPSSKSPSPPVRGRQAQGQVQSQGLQQSKSKRTSTADSKSKDSRRKSGGPYPVHGAAPGGGLPARNGSQQRHLVPSQQQQHHHQIQQQHTSAPQWGMHQHQHVRDHEMTNTSMNYAASSQSVPSPQNTSLNPNITPLAYHGGFTAQANYPNIVQAHQHQHQHTYPTLTIPQGMDLDPAMAFGGYPSAVSDTGQHPQHGNLFDQNVGTPSSGMLDLNSPHSADAASSQAIFGEINSPAGAGGYDWSFERIFMNTSGQGEHDTDMDVEIGGEFGNTWAGMRWKANSQSPPGM